MPVLSKPTKTKPARLVVPKFNPEEKDVVTYDGKVVTVSWKNKDGTYKIQGVGIDTTVPLSKLSPYVPDHRDHPHRWAFSLTPKSEKTIGPVY